MRKVGWLVHIKAVVKFKNIFGRKQYFSRTFPIREKIKHGLFKIKK